MSSQPDAVAAEFDADSLPVRLQFIAGVLDVPFGELSSIGPGYVFDLMQATHGHVEVRAYGRTIGRGELVEVDGRVGVRILTCT
ncbi:MAG: FliM/FliN family flagellar motor switch protein [Gammaproteobacteria bacterium]|nr:FliM/FliN family flagellar motor switch protein [Gammaproteobacteria bacterium]MDE0365951.1 FliM/FliN family flagellar motor switch protein [Gammaproteobacteria bacterium]